MRLPVEKIKEAILHPEEEVRLRALRYFTDADSDDATLMPLVIQAVEKYGRGSAFRILRDAEHLVQTAQTLDWLIQELRRDYDLQLVPDDNLRFALALVVLEAPVELLTARKSEIDALASFADELRGPLDERIQMASWSWDQGWNALEEFGRQTIRKRDFSLTQSRYALRLLEALARHRDRADHVLDLLRRTGDSNNRLLDWLEPEIVKLSGLIGCEAAIPFLVERLGHEDSLLSDAAAIGLRWARLNRVRESMKVSPEKDGRMSDRRVRSSSGTSAKGVRPRLGNLADTSYVVLSIFLAVLIRVKVKV